MGVTRSPVGVFVHVRNDGLVVPKHRQLENDHCISVSSPMHNNYPPYADFEREGVGSWLSGPRSP